MTSYKHLFSHRLRRLSVSALAVSAGIMGYGEGAFADSATDSLQAQITQLQKQIDALKAAQSSPISAPVSSDGTLTWHGITLYGTIDVGVSNQSHGLPYNADVSQGISENWNKYGSRSVTSVTPGGMSQSSIGLRGTEPVYDDISAVFNLKTGFNPVSGTLVNGPKSLLDNYGVASANQSASGDSSRAGQLFNDVAYGGLSSPTYGTLTLGRHHTPLYDAAQRNDPQSGSYAFSLFTGTYPSGYTDATRLDDSVRYDYQYGPLRFQALYQMPGNSGIGALDGHDTAYSFVLGYTQSIFNLDLSYQKKNAAQSLAANSNTTFTATLANIENVLLATTIDLNPVKLYGGYEHITFSNPDGADTIPGGTAGTSVGGYAVTALTTNAFSNSKYTVTEKKSLHVPWLGVSYKPIDKLNLAAAAYMIIQDNYSGFNNATCLSRNLKTCAGNEKFLSLSADYQLSKRFDAYAGIEWSKVEDGLYSNQGAFHNNNLSPIVGGRLNF